MTRHILLLVSIIITIIFLGCSENSSFSDDVVIPDFNYPKTVEFAENLSFYKIFEETPSNLTPKSNFQLLELSSELFTDYAYKQRLIKVPEGSSISRTSDGELIFPDGTILTKTFFYYKDERDTALGKRIIETRLLIKENNTWNVATYIWDDNQIDAEIEDEGLDTEVKWIDKNGAIISTNYHIPNENECIACHQSDSKMTPLGTKLRNINKNVTRNETQVNQIDYLHSLGILDFMSSDKFTNIADYKNVNESLNNRARAYFDMNCSHCHKPGAWEESAKKKFDFRYETHIEETGILSEKDRIKRLIQEQEMPFIGTTILDKEGVNLMIEFIDSQK